MHPGQVEVSVEALDAAIEAQAPELYGLPLARVASAGTVVAPFRLGEAFLVRLPLVPSADAAARVRLLAEADHALALAGRLPVEVPRPIQVCEPFEGYPGWWSIWTWVDGVSLDTLLGGAEATSGVPLDQDALARDLAHLLRAFHDLPCDGAWSGAARGGRPLADTDWVRTSIVRSAHLVDPAAATALWERTLAAPPHAGPAVTIQGDPMPGNLIMRSGRLAGLIDIGEACAGDPASDLAPAWTFFDEPARSTFAAAMGLDAAAWERGRGWAFEQAIGGLHYYEHNNPRFFAGCRATLDRLLGSA